MPLPTLADLERTTTSFEAWIQAARQAGYLQGAILKRIRDKKIYRLHYDTFADAVKAELDMSRSRAYQLIEHVEIVAQLNVDPNVQLTEFQTRPLVRVPAEKRDDVIQKAAESGKLTAKSITKAAKLLTLSVVSPDDDDDYDDDDYDDDEDPEDEIPIEDQIKEDNSKIEAVCRAITKPLNDLSDDLVWLKYQGIKNSAIGHIRTGCKLLRAAKCEICPKCNGGGCEACKVGDVMTGRVPDIVKRQLS